MMRSRHAAAVLASLFVAGPQPVASQASAPLSAEQAYSLGTQAYLYAYPLVLMERTRAVQNRPINQFVHAQAYPGPQTRAVIRPNVDTLYSTAWLDLSREPIVMSVPDMGDRYYLIQCLDAWTETFSVPGTRTTGNQARRFAIVGPGWKSTLPAGVTEIRSPTNTVWMIGRIQTNGPADYPNVRALQKGFQLAPLSGTAVAASTAATIPATTGRTPPEQIAAQTASDFFSAFADALVANPPHADDATFVARFKSLGLVPGRKFDAASLSPAVRAALDRAARDAQERLSRTDATVRNGWRFFTTIGRYGSDYLNRASIARFGLGALPPEDAIYPSIEHDADGRPFSGANRYVMHMPKSALPPVKAFWSMTLYDADGYFAPNAINRYAIGDRDQLRFNDDGSLDVYIQTARPAEDRVANWLPAPAGDFNLTLRLYWPGPEALSGGWAPPSVRRVP
jgi:hypothetical protein